MKLVGAFDDAELRALRTRRRGPSVVADIVDLTGSRRRRRVPRRAATSRRRDEHDPCRCRCRRRPIDVTASASGRIEIEEVLGAAAATLPGSVLRRTGDRGRGAAHVTRSEECERSASPETNVFRWSGRRRAPARAGPVDRGRDGHGPAVVARHRHPRAPRSRRGVGRRLRRSPTTARSSTPRVRATRSHAVGRPDAEGVAPTMEAVGGAARAIDAMAPTYAGASTPSRPGGRTAPGRTASGASAATATSPSSGEGDSAPSLAGLRGGRERPSSPGRAGTLGAERRPRRWRSLPP